MIGSFHRPFQLKQTGPARPVLKQSLRSTERIVDESGGASREYHLKAKAEIDKLIDEKIGKGTVIGADNAS
jgi:hypothetical protein